MKTYRVQWHSAILIYRTMWREGKRRGYSDKLHTTLLFTGKETGWWIRLNEDQGTVNRGMTVLYVQWILELSETFRNFPTEYKNVLIRASACSFSSMIFHKVWIIIENPIWKIVWNEQSLILILKIIQLVMHVKCNCIQDLQTDDLRKIKNLKKNNKITKLCMRSQYFFSANQENQHSTESEPHCFSHDQEAYSSLGNIPSI